MSIFDYKIAISIDLQLEDFLLNPTGFVQQRLDNIKEFLEYSATKDIPVYDVHSGSRETIPEILEAARNRSFYKVLYKKTNSAFEKLYTSESTAEFLRFESQLLPESNELFIIGQSDACCVLETVQGALERGYTVQISRKTISDSFNAPWKKL